MTKTHKIGFTSGMLARSITHPSGRVLRITFVDNESHVLAGKEEGMWWGYNFFDALDPAEWNPDLDDAPTRGALLGVLRELLKDPTVHVVPRREGEDPTRYSWVVLSPSKGECGRGTTEGEALAHVWQNLASFEENGNA
jgi:hypothetical protein